MKYEKIVKGSFISRPNRFIAIVDIDGKEERVHVKNTGRCRELLVPGAAVYLEDHQDKPGRKTRFSLIGVKKGSLMINMDSQAPNKVVGEGLVQGSIRLPGLSGIPDKIKPESTYKDSRYDFYVEGKNDLGNPVSGYIEVKGVTLEENGTARFPDAPTERGIKHINGLAGALKEGYSAWILLVIQMKGIHHFEPNDVTHKAFGDALRAAERDGVKVLAYDCIVTEDTLVIDQPVPCVL